MSSPVLVCTMSRRTRTGSIPRRLVITWSNVRVLQEGWEVVLLVIMIRCEANAKGQEDGMRAWRVVVTKRACRLIYQVRLRIFLRLIAQFAEQLEYHSDSCPLSCATERLQAAPFRSSSVMHASCQPEALVVCLVPDQLNMMQGPTQSRPWHASHRKADVI